jgi:hypothetical protein
MTKFPPDKHVRIHRLQVELFRPAPKRNLLMFYFTCSPEHTTFLFFTGLSNKDKYTLSMVSLLKQSSQKVKGYYTPRFFATDSLAVKLSCTLSDTCPVRLQFNKNVNKNTINGVSKLLSYTWTRALLLNALVSVGCDNSMLGCIVYEVEELHKLQTTVFLIH